MNKSIFLENIFLEIKQFVRKNLQTKSCVLQRNVIQNNFAKYNTIEDEQMTMLLFCILFHKSEIV